TETSPTEPPVPVELEAYLIAIQDLIASNEPAELLAGIAAATGRDYPEVLSFSYFGATEDGHFNRITLQEHPYLLRFSSSGQEPIDLLTILPAVDVLAAINKLWGEAEVVKLEGKPFEAPETQTLITQVDQVAYVALGRTGIVATFPAVGSISPLQELYLKIAIAYFSPPQGESLFRQRYMSHHWSPEHLSGYLLTHNQIPLTSRGVLIPSQGQLPMHSSETQPPALPKEPADDERPQALTNQATDKQAAPATRPVATSHPPPSLEGRQRDQALIESLLAVVKQQAGTIATLSETIAHLRADLATARHGHPPGRTLDQAPLQELEHALQAAQAEQVRLQSLAEDYCAKWQEASQRLTQIYSVASPPQEAETSPDSPPAIAAPEPTTQSPTKTTSRKKKRTTRKKATPRREKPGRPPSDPKQSIVYQRAVRTWELTQQWNRDHDYQSDAAIQISKSLLTRSFGVHARAIRHFWADFAAEIQAENERLGIDEGAIHFNKGDKLEVYINHVKPMLEQEGFYR
ncbi:MAG: protelomerase family protein, partial [Cyanobacteria bacterium J06559_3]